MDSNLVRDGKINPASLGFLEHLAEGVLIVDRNRHILAVNSVLERMLGYQSAQLVGKGCGEVLGCRSFCHTASLCSPSCPFGDLWCVEPDPQKPSGSYREIALTAQNGNLVEVSASFAPLELPFLNQSYSSNFPASSPGLQADQLGCTNLTIILLRDITEQKQQERIKTEFVNASAHHLRTPLASIKTSIGLLVDNVGEDFNPLLKRLLETIQSSTTRMERMVKDLIELSNLQNGRVQLKLELVEVESLIERAAVLSRPRLEAKNQTLLTSLEVEQPLFVKADFNRISQVLEHIISNASKFSGPGSRIELTAGLLNPHSEDIASESGHNREVVFKVQDFGIGIAVEDQPVIFERFYQGQVVENTDEAGSGLGLPLAKALVELNGGRMGLESRLGQGSTFFFSLPVHL